MSSDSEGDDVDLAEELVTLDLDSDWEGEDGDLKNSEDNNLESDQEEMEKSPPAKKVRTQVCLSPTKLPKTLC